MKKLFPFILVISVVTLFSCTKEYSLENGGDLSNIIGANCRIAKITYVDTSTGIGIGSIAAIINAADKIADVTAYDSLTATIDFNSSPVYFSDTVYIDADEYYIIDPVSTRIKQLHGLVDPTNPASTQFELFFTYDATGFLINKSYTLSLFPAFPVVSIDYTYSGGNLTHMVARDLTTGDLISDADLNYYTNISPKNYVYLFPDEASYAQFNQFFNFGNRTANAVQDMKIKYYDPGNVVRDSAVSTFTGYTLSRDNYVLSVIMNGDDQPSIPAAASKLVFTYKCK